MLREALSELNRAKEHGFKEFIDKMKTKFKGRLTLVLFGSRCRNEATPLSDFDLLMVTEDVFPEPEKRRLRMDAKDYSVDLHIYSTVELTTLLPECNTVLLDALLEGRVVYDGLVAYEKLKNLAADFTKTANIEKSSAGWIKRKTS